MNPILILFLSFWMISAQEITEVMADPNSLADSEAEFVELYDSSIHPFPDTLLLQIQDKTYILPPNSNSPYRIIGPQGLKSYMDSTQIYTPSSWSLVNSAEIKIILLTKSKQIIDSITIPKAVAGQSWQKQNQTWSLSSTKSPWGDLASPLWSGKTQDIAQIKLIETKCTDEGVQVGLKKNNGDLWEIQSLWFNPLNPQESDSLNLDWGGESLSLSTYLSTSLIHLRLTLKKGAPLYGQTWDTTLLCQTNSPLKITELYPSPTSTETEWIEIENQGSNRIDLSQVYAHNQYNPIPLSADVYEIPAHSRVLWVQDSLKFRQKYGAIRLKLLQSKSWPGLNNSGSSLKLMTKDSILLDSIQYGASKTGKSLCRKSTEWETCISSPGFAWSPPTQKLQIPLKVLSKSKQNLLLWNWQEESLVFNLYDLEGNLFDSFACQTQECTHSLAQFPIGPVILKSQSPTQNENIQIQVLP